MEIKITELIKNYEAQSVLDIKTLTLTQGLTCFMGANGCGKSTLLNIIAGQLDYDSGMIHYDGTRYSKKLAGQMTLVHQKPYLFHRSVYDNIAYPLTIRKLSKKTIKNKVEAMISALNIEELTHKKATELSGGETQKVALARGLIFEPKLLMLDESTSNIDNESMGVIETAIRDYAKVPGRTVLLVTHDPLQAEKLTNKIVRLP